MTIGYLIDAHQNLEIRMAYAPFFDFIFVAQKDYVSAFKEAGFSNVFWLPVACDPDVHCRPKIKSKNGA